MNGRSRWLLLALTCTLFASAERAVAEEALPAIGSPEAFGRAIAAARPGDTIVIADGLHDGWTLDVPASVSGASDQPISIRGATPGGVTFTGKSRINIRGDHIELADLVFEATGAPSVAIRGKHNRVTRVSFIRAGTRSNTHLPILRIESPASDNEVDHCEFIGSASVSIQVKDRDERRPLPLRNRIHHNLFKDIPRYSKNGQEPVQLKCGGRSGCELMTRVEYNTFVRANGDDELVSVKSSRNVIRYNVALDSGGGISLRGGDNNLVEGNVLIRTRVGISVTGDQQTVVNNFIDQPRQVGISIRIGSKRFRAATDAVVAHNTVIRAETPICFCLRERVATDMPRNNMIVNNIFVAQRSGDPIISAKPPNGLGDYLSINEVQRNLFWWQGGVTDAAAVRTYESNGNIVADPRLDLSDPMIPRLRPESPARQRALPGYGAADLTGAARGTGDLPDIGAIEASEAMGR